MGSGPQVPNANDLSKAQTQSNIQTAVAQTGLNAIGTTGPGGSTSYQVVGTWPDGTPKFQQTTSLSPELQGLYNTGINTQQQIGNTAQNLAGGLNQSLGQPINQPGLNTSPVGDFNSVRQQTLDSLNSELDYQSNRDQGSLEQQLANQGIQRGTEAYSAAMRDFNTGKSANRTNAILAANQAQGQAQDLALNSAGFGNQALQQQFQNNLTGRSQGINELLSLLGGSQVQQPQAPGTPQTGINGTDVTGNAWNQYNAQQNQSNSFWNGLGALGGTVGGWLFSDRRLKTDIRDTGMETPGGIPVKDFRYKGSPMMQRGVMAQDVKREQPEAVRKGPGGFLMVAPRMVK